MARIIFNGTAGDRWRNGTGKVLYQFHASLSNTCGLCLQYHMAFLYGALQLHGAAHQFCQRLGGFGWQPEHGKVGKTRELSFIFIPPDWHS